ncbi:hypothetical protein KDD17_11335 [Sulfitobacter albidus]|uniref:Uncharacterized protein n=1 Tax=Sulfitobacter albidus TaxID=2829501 RepID=A0A975JBU2_9RHOB|nr:hypothetical protein [Sulfitobacter albidus]QUJ75553.1 hypothetical protein KDD17_11335 [Sulfitobacter albidus]
MENSNALKIAESIMTLTRDAVLRDDPNAFAAYFTLPQIVETFEGRTELKCIEDVHRTFWAVRRHYDQQGITDFTRICTEASYKTPNIIEYIYESVYFKGKIELPERPSTYAILRLTGGQWRINYTMYGVTNINAFSDRLLNRGEDDQTAA